MFARPTIQGTGTGGGGLGVSKAFYGDSFLYEFMSFMGSRLPHSIQTLDPSHEY